jgi:cysteinyl-tRNA synthetase
MTKMTDEERRVSEERRKLIAEASRAANPTRHNRVLPQNDRATDLLARLGVSVADSDGPVNWKALTK